jgi:hypothetical protein
MSNKLAFRCRNCRCLHEASCAGENHLPHACRVCSHGVLFVKDGQPGIDEALAHPHAAPHAAALASLPKEHLSKSFLQGGRTHPVVPGQLQKFFLYENWEVLSDCSPERLTELGLTADQVEAHVPFITEVSRGPDTTEVVEHEKGPAEDCQVCKVNRPGTQGHTPGAKNTVTNPAHVHTQRPVSPGELERRKPTVGKMVSVTATEGGSIKDKVA